MCISFHRCLQKLLSKTYVKKREAGRLMAEALRSSQTAIDAKLDQWNTLLSQQAVSRDQSEQVPGDIKTELQQSYEYLRRELQVTSRVFCYLLVFVIIKCLLPLAGLTELVARKTSLL